MQLKTFSLPLLAVICTLSLGDVRPVAAAVHFPTSLGAAFPAAVQRFAQQHVFSQSDPDPEDFWQRARDLGDRARCFGDKLIKDAAERSQEIRDKIGELTERMETVVRGATALNEELPTSTALSFVDNISEDLERVFAAVLAELERKEVVAVTLDKAGAALIGVCTRYGMDEQRAREHWGTVRPAIETMVVVLDRCLRALYLLQAVLFSLVMLIPESWVLRPVLGVFGLAGPVEGAPAAWAQSVFYGATVPKGSPFSFFQKLGMTL
ncbi:hypothetical protein B0H17DRAFT_1199625 [Mycena rosella]|uniref:Uncharacterized protein n=1 Tax=Mycena rosella TaxID=1033263 RepID=A0AAD7GGS1_MYCRO|nr:hypothetical protein B0H17DRAFT_1199625 [Mycena rosella]